MAWVRHTHATVNSQSPQALATCDRCGFTFNHVRLSWQCDWRGPRLQNLGILVCPDCTDTPQQNGQRTIIIPADPLPITNPRPDSHMFMGQSSAQSAINNSSQQVTPTPAYVAPGYQGYVPTPALIFDSASAVSVTLSNGDRTALNTGSTEVTQGAKVNSPADPAQVTVRFYFEITLTTLNPPGGSNLKAGVSNDIPFVTAGSTAGAGAFVDVSGSLWADGGLSGSGIGLLQQGDIVGIAVRAGRAWFRKTPGGYWNGSVTADPYTNVGGLEFSAAIELLPYVLFGGTGGSTGNAWTVNTDAALFTGEMPLTFSAWPNA